MGSLAWVNPAEVTDHPEEFGASTLFEGAEPA